MQLKFGGEINKIPVILGVMNFFYRWQYGVCYWRVVSRSIKISNDKKLPFILICCSGGARMQEGAISLMQLAKTTSQLAKFSKMADCIYPF